MKDKKPDLFQPETLNLRWPVQSGTREISSLTLTLISHADHAKVLKDHDGNETKIFTEFARLSCGLSEDEVSRIKTPDWNTLRLKLSDLVAKGSDFYFKRASIAFNPDSPLLLQPITSDTGSLITELTLQIPTVATTELMKKHTDPEQRNLFITIACTDLTPGEISRLSAPDWNHLQGRINSFLNETADYFPAATSTSSPT